MTGRTLLTIAHCDGTFSHHHFEEETELLFVIMNGMKWQEMRLLIYLEGRNPLLARRWAEGQLRKDMEREGRYGSK